MLAALLVLVWTSVAAEQEPMEAADTVRVHPKRFHDYLLAKPKPADKNIIEAHDGYSWLVWSSGMKNAFMMGFIAAACLVAEYSSDLLLDLTGLTSVFGPIPLRRGIFSPTDRGYAALLDWTREAGGQLLVASWFRFKTEDYVHELDALYRDPDNRPITLIDAMYIAIARLDGKPVDLAEWRDKAVAQPVKQR